MGQYIAHPGADALPVTVTVDGHDRIGYLEAWRQDDEGDWSGYVRWVGPVDGGYSGLHLGWYAADLIRPDEPDDAAPATT